LEPVVNLMTDDEAVTSPQVAAQKDAVVEPTRKVSMNDFIFKVTDADAPGTNLLKKEDDLYQFFHQLQDQIEILWNARTVVL